ncbi:N-acetylmuramic acid 6-phosphate etherase [Dellaglioa algida]|uniref:N-acetylmuramic acid 6-phosphate etherase n=1 Tax=Dellaglioa algida TaxID=105612 RepID=A0A5C6MC32_9LACO|nr:N-acetylmuramic acid 6-phosphate etherase [Dellaglioa algida]MDK1719559.1 N-acetylmuramic acid 6-phosphate etherase [Dellaglioa algida]MDK1722902.1 N-acetylmuramic acid 6-phosphate etherase [Dellaglioa algida]MDK1740383.1 N-acetylmuramic acid 6-phosphate etherase [Dellaglioa algida]TWW11793.1 N-acetylmuramic acid 6-phosphate etherase 1 [Dellaglioa algida]
MDMVKIATEQRNNRTTHIDKLNGHKIATLINQEDAVISDVVGQQTEQIGLAIEQIATRFKKGGRLIYMGAGTSGRLGALDAIELQPTYGVPNDRAFGLLAGGQKAMFRAVEGAEDSKTLAIEDLKRQQLTTSDVIIAIAASGRTPYTIGAIEAANKAGALTVSVTCTADNEMSQIAKIAINLVVGPEVITGSTRMKAGTAQKMVLNMISTGVMIKAGYIYENLMINVQPTNKKLIQRATDMLTQILGLEEQKSSELLKEAHNSVALAILMNKKNVNYESAKQILKDNDGQIL